MGQVHAALSRVSLNLFSNFFYDLVMNGILTFSFNWFSDKTKNEFK